MAMPRCSPWSRSCMPAQAALELPDPGDGADGVQRLRRDAARCSPAGRRRRPACSGVARAASMARRVPGRPAPIGAVTPGKSTTSRRGRTGSVRRSVMGSCLSSIPGHAGGLSGALRARRCTHRVHPRCHGCSPAISFGRCPMHLAQCRTDFRSARSPAACQIRQRPSWQHRRPATRRHGFPCRLLPRSLQSDKLLAVLAAHRF